MKEKVKLFFQEKVMRFSWQRVGFVILIIVGIGLVFTSALAVYGYSLRERTLPGLYLGQFAVGGMQRDELKAFLEKITDKLVNEGWTFVYEKDSLEKTYKISPVLVTDEGSVDLAHFDVAKEVDRLLLLGKDKNVVFVGSRALKNLLFTKTKLKAENIYINKIRLGQILMERLSEVETPPQDANVKITSLSPLTYDITAPQIGEIFDYEKALNEVENNWSILENKEIVLEKSLRQSIITEDEVKTVIGKLAKVFSVDGLELAYRDPETKREYSWQISNNQLAGWVKVKKDEQGNLFFGLDKVLVSNFLEDKVVPQINVPARDAKFKMGENGAVIEFQGSRPGLELNIYGGESGLGTIELIENAFKERSLHDSGFTKVVTVSVERVEPKVKTADVNNLGISEVLGVGISDFSNSPNNRIKNIKNAVNKLNGILIKPGEEFSTLKFTGPFTLEGGYFPELVIKGDEMKAEIAGGLCQIGTTLFRMAMNSGMPITQRQNHSLVVSHYNDPVNNLPGTDATVYDPAPDFRFLNDTGGYILIQTAIDFDSQELIFTLWGTSDGRSGSYTHPVVSKWYSPGETRNIETTKLEPGKVQCQNPFVGADASFTYTRILPSGEKVERIFESHYRSLPKICLVGVAEPIITEVTSSTSSGELPIVEN